MVDLDIFRKDIVNSTLNLMEKWSQSAENLIMGTAMQESHFTHRKQLGGGPALGLFQMEPATHDDIWNNYICHRNNLNEIMKQFTKDALPDQLENDDRYAAAMCRVHYMRVPEALPFENDVVGLAAYWKSYYNTPSGAGTMNEFIENYERMTSDGP